ncbi:hypothetical protein AAZV13_08G042100 [Glycine max]
MGLNSLFNRNRDGDGDGTIDFEEFRVMMMMMGSRHDTTDRVKNVSET